MADDLRARLEQIVAERDAAYAKIARVEAECARAEHGALRWADPLPVPEWVGRVRAALADRPLPDQDTEEKP